ncbi:MAG: hypothetical protein BroJett018_53540 [Chloroflexota bacterium]|nr:MAG: hypothetical protein BroJett018_53540 [Chloroflexota bacterium]
MIVSIDVPRLNDSHEDFDTLFDFWHKVTHSEKSDVLFTFEQCSFLQQNAVAFLGGLARLAQYQGRKVIIRKATIRQNVKDHLIRNEFLCTLLDESKPEKKANTIPYHEDRRGDKRSYIKYLQESWLQSGWTGQISKELKELITQFVIEAYVNVFEHARSPVGVITCGQRFPNLDQLKLALVDFGVSIPANVRKHLSKPEMPAGEAIDWAFARGRTTKTSTMTGGLGLDNLKGFIAENGGNLLVYSGNGYASVKNGSFMTETRPTGFIGTLVQITLKTKASYYRLPPMTESDGDLF